MELSKKILNFSIAFGIVMLSLSVFVYSLKDSKAYAKAPVTSDGYEVVGVISYTVGMSMYSAVVGFNPTTKEMKALNRKNVKEMNDETK